MAGSDGQALAALGTTTAQHNTPILGGHTGAESVCAFAFQDAGLERSFHVTPVCLVVDVVTVQKPHAAIIKDANRSEKEAALYRTIGR